MILKSLFVLFYLIFNVKAQITFAPLSSSGIKVTTTTFSFVTLSTASTLATISTVSQSQTTTKSNECTTEAKLACKNGGLCINLSNSNFYCICTANYIGEFCTIPVTTVPSATIPATTTLDSSFACPQDAKQACKNGATCLLIDQLFPYCLCTDDYVGFDCSIPSTNIQTTTISITTLAPEIAPCPSSFKICKNGGKCLILDGTDIICKCEQGFTGEVCEISTTSSVSVLCPTGLNVCFNGAACNILNGIEVKCLCKQGFTGGFCEISLTPTTTSTTTTTTTITTTTTTTTTLPPNFCSRNPCKNGSQCLLLPDTTGLCFCSSGFYGLYCETKSCSPSPCQNDQTCVQGSSGPQCLCINRFSGAYCDKVLF